MWSDPSVPAAEVRVGKYRLLRRIAAGGMAEVFVATDDGVSLWAVKLILPHLADHTEFIGLFLDEARLASLLNHPNVARVRDMGMEDGRLFLAMEYARGQPLSALLTRLKEQGRALTPAQAAEILAQAAAGLNAAHDAKARDGSPLELVHRDVSPQNLLLTEDGVVKVVDFGIAKARNKLVVTQVNTTRGKPWYMSPEQMRGERLDRRADIFSLGAVLFELLLGTRLFGGEIDQVMWKALNEPLPQIKALKPETPDALAEIIARACARAPEERFETAWEMEQELRAFAASEGGAGDLGALVRENFPPMPASVAELLGPSSAPAKSAAPKVRSGPSRPVSRPAGRRPESSGGAVRARRPGTGAAQRALTVGEAPPDETEKTPANAPSPAAELPEVTAADAPPPAAPPAPAVLDPADDAQRVRTDIPKRRTGAAPTSKKRAVIVGAAVVVVFFAAGGGLVWRLTSKAQPAPAAVAPAPPPPSLLSGSAPAPVPVPVPAPAPSAPPVAEAPVEAAVAADHRARLRVSCSASPCGIVVDGDLVETAPHEVRVKPGKHLVQVAVGDDPKPRGHRLVELEPDALQVLHFGPHGETGGGSSYAAMLDVGSCLGAVRCEIPHLRRALSINPRDAAVQRKLGLDLAHDATAASAELAIFHLENYLLLQEKPAKDEAVVKAKIAELKHLQ